MNRKRMKRLYEVVRAIPPEQFKIHTWGTTDGCGTVGCAAGHATLDPELRAEGLRNYNDVSDAWPGSMVPAFNKWYGEGAMRRFLQITERRTTWLFHDKSYLGSSTSPKRVARRIKMLLNGTAPV